MEDWTKAFFEAIDTWSEEVDRFFQDIADEVDEAIDELVEFSEDVGKQVRESLHANLPIDDMTAEFERAVNEFVEPISEFYQGLDFDVFDLDEDFDDTDPFVPIAYVPPTADRNSACMGCQHYHGHLYGKNLLVCGMHPYGWEGESCPDWESENLN
ncbi:MAG: hypothetical protein SWY16_16085 [Cyanobacteriota bacterium]|nr:hypothetical protein [Cyanobacteriota bacterium]